MFIIELWKKLHEVGVNDKICRGVDVSSFFRPFKAIFGGKNMTVRCLTRTSLRETSNGSSRSFK